MKKIKLLILLIVTIFISIQLTNFIWIKNSNRQIYDKYKYVESYWLMKKYNDLNITLGDCVFIKKNIDFIVSYSATYYSKEELDRLLYLTKHCETLKDDFIFLNSLDSNKLVLTKNEDKNLELISLYWFFLPEHHKNSLDKYFTKENHEIIKLLKENFYNSHEIRN